MNAKAIITDVASEMVKNLAQTQVEEMKIQNAEYQAWLALDGGVTMYGSFSTHASINKFIYMVKSPSNPTIYLRDVAHKVIFENKKLSYLQSNLTTQIHNGWEDKYISDIVSTNTWKLKKSLAQHLDNTMSATDIEINISRVGAEVKANVDGKKFVTFGSLCGGEIQCLHYRYRSSLK